MKRHHLFGDLKCSGVVACRESINACLYFPRIPACAQNNFQIRPSQLRLPPSWHVSMKWLCHLTKSPSGCLGPLTSKDTFISLSVSYYKCPVLFKSECNVCCFAPFLDTWIKWWSLILHVKHMWRSTRSWWSLTCLLSWTVSGELGHYRPQMISTSVYCMERIYNHGTHKGLKILYMSQAIHKDSLKCVTWVLMKKGIITKIKSNNKKLHLLLHPH